jgi:hypothetical protein
MKTQASGRNMSTNYPFLVAHADWGSEAKKRQLTVAVLEGTAYRVKPPSPIDDPASLIPSLLELANGRHALLGFDFPIGLPSAFAEKAGIRSFISALQGFGKEKWTEFYTIAETPQEISIYRPFYPRGIRGTKQFHLTSGLRVETMEDLLRECEHKTLERGAASSLFWTLGGKQVGRSAIIGWRDVIAPAMREMTENVGIWPFQGGLDELLKSRKLTIAETYPTEACVVLGLPPPGKGWSKRNPDHRKAHGPHLIRWAKRRNLILHLDLLRAMRNGFGADLNGDDRFDSVVGLFGMLEVVLGHRSNGAPKRERITSIEGWIFGQRE